MTDSIKDLAAAIKRVEDREHARLIMLATKAGFFERKISTPEIKDMFTGFLAALETPRQSQLQALKRKLSREQQKIKQRERIALVRKKILLGSFFIAQARHKPKFLPSLRANLLSFLELDKNKDRIQRNKTLLYAFLATGVNVEIFNKIADGKDGTTRQIVLGAYLEWAFENDPAFLASQRQEIATFVDAVYTKATGEEKQALLAEYLPDNKKGDR